MGDKKRKELKPNLYFLWVWEVGWLPGQLVSFLDKMPILGQFWSQQEPRYYSRFGDWLGFWTGWGRARKHLWCLDSTLDLDRSQAKGLSLHCLLRMLLFFCLSLGITNTRNSYKGTETRVKVWVEPWSGFDFQSPPSSHRGVVSQTQSKSLWGCQHSCCSSHWPVCGSVNHPLQSHI